MNKKFLSAILFGALAIASTGSFVSCKDYDDDIDNLQTQINGLASAKDLSDKVSALQSAISSAQTAAEAKAAAAQVVADAAKAAAEKAGADAKAANDAAAAAADAAAKALDAAVAVLEKDINDVKGAQAAAEEACKKALDELQAAVDKAATKEELKAAQDAQAAVAEGLEKNIKEVKASVEELASTKADKKDLEAAKEAALAAAADAKDAAVKAGKDAAAALAAAEKKLNEAVAAADAAAKKAQETADKANAAVEELAKTAASKEDLAVVAAAAKKAQDAADAAKEDAAVAAAAAQKAQDAADKNAADITAQAKAIAAKADAKAVENLEKSVADLKTIVDTLAGGEEVVEMLSELANGFGEQLAALNGEVNTMVTSVELYYNCDDQDRGTASDYDKDLYNLSFDTYVEKTTKFGYAEEGVEGGYTFKEGQTHTTTDSFVIRVSPTNVDLKPEMISLINSRGEKLENVVVKEVKQYNEKLLTRAASANGLWTVTFGFDDAKMDTTAFYANTLVPQENDNPKHVLFSVAVSNKNDDRLVVSAYDVTLDLEDGDFATNILIGENHTSISWIHNRFEQTEDGTSTKDFTELVWTNGMMVKDSINDENTAEGDNRQNRQILPVKKSATGKYPIDIVVGAYMDQDGNVVTVPSIRGFYVTLDTENALESGNGDGKFGSEYAAWTKAYKYTGLNKYFEGNKGTISIDDLGGADFDVIGFRIYAVNMDGTLLDPDGQAFYVATVDEPVVCSAEVKLDSFPAHGQNTKYAVNSKIVELPEASWFKVNYSYPAEMLKDNTKDPNGFNYSVRYLTLNDDNEWVDVISGDDIVKGIQIYADDATDVEDDLTYEMQISILRYNTPYLVYANREINLSITKQLLSQKTPTAAGLRPGQVPTIWFNAVDGDNAVTSRADGVYLSDIYENLIPVSNPYTVNVDSIKDETEIENLIKANIEKIRVDNKNHKFFVTTTYDFKGISSVNPDSVYTGSVEVEIKLASEWSNLTVTAAKDTIEYGFAGELPSVDKVKSPVASAAVEISEPMTAGNLSVATDEDGEDIISVSGPAAKYIAASIADGEITIEWLDDNTHNISSNVTGTISYTVEDVFGNQQVIERPIVIKPAAVQP